MLAFASSSTEHSQRCMRYSRSAAVVTANMSFWQKLPMSQRKIQDFMYMFNFDQIESK